MLGADSAESSFLAANRFPTRCALPERFNCSCLRRPTKSLHLAFNRGHDDGGRQPKCLHGAMCEKNELFSP